MRVEINNNYNFFLIMPECTFAGASGGVKKIMPNNIENMQLDASDVIELRSFQMWVKREMSLFKNNPALQNEVAGNIDKATNIPLKLLMRAFGQ